MVLVFLAAELLLAATTSPNGFARHTDEYLVGMINVNVEAIQEAFDEAIVCVPDRLAAEFSGAPSTSGGGLGRVGVHLGRLRERERAGDEGEGNERLEELHFFFVVVKRV